MLHSPATLRLQAKIKKIIKSETLENSLKNVFLEIVFKLTRKYQSRSHLSYRCSLRTVNTEKQELAYNSRQNFHFEGALLT